MITLIRIFLIPCIVIKMFNGSWLTAFFLFTTASLTDVVDGLIARHYNQITIIGACLDPIADKLLILSCLGAFTVIQSPSAAIPLWFFIAMACKEFLLAGGIILIYMLHGFTHIVPSIFGKVATLLYCFFIGWLLLSCHYSWHSLDGLYLFVCISIGMLLCTLIHYGSQVVRLLVVW